LRFDFLSYFFSAFYNERQMDRLTNFVSTHPGWTLVILIVLVIVLILEIVFYVTKEKFDVSNGAGCAAQASAVDPMAAHEILGLNMAQGLSPDAISKDPKRSMYDDYLSINYGIGPYTKDVTTNPDFTDDYSDDKDAPLTPTQKKDGTPDMTNPDSS